MNFHQAGDSVLLRKCLHTFSLLVFLSALGTGRLRAEVSAAGQAGAVAEPKTPGIFYLLDPQSNQISLEYKAVRASSLVASVEGAQSPIRVADGGHVRLLVRLPAGVAFADAGVQFYQFESKNDHRAIEFVAFKQPRRLKRPPMAEVPVDSSSVGSSSVILTPKTALGAGEYCLAMGKSTKDAYCFGVDEGAGPAAVAQGGSSVANAQSSGGGGAAMTNADVLKMVGAGLSPDIVIGSIRQAPARNFDLSIDGLISLKKSKVPDAVVAAMQQQGSGGSNAGPTQASAPSGSAPAGAAPPMQASGPVPEPPDESTFYYVTPAGKLGKLEKLRADRIMEAELSHRNETGWKVFGARAGVRLPSGNVTLVVKLYKKVFIFEAGHEDDIRFRRWEPSTGARETWYSTRPPNRYRQKTLEQGEFEFTAAKIGENTYKITPNEPLIPGEYCASTGDFHQQFCFGVDGGR